VINKNSRDLSKAQYIAMILHVLLLLTEIWAEHLKYGL